jgi:hypothetical protein
MLRALAQMKPNQNGPALSRPARSISRSGKAYGVVLGIIDGATDSMAGASVTVVSVVVEVTDSVVDGPQAARPSAITEARATAKPILRLFI